MKPVFSRESAQGIQCLSDAIAMMKTPKVRTCRPRVSAAVFGLALSVGASGAILTSPREAFAADSSASNALPNEASNSLLSSVGSSRPSNSAVAYHTVADGETLWDISTEHSVDVVAIKQANGLAENAVIKSGQVLKIPSGPVEGSELTESSTPSVQLIAVEDDLSGAADLKDDSSSIQSTSESALTNQGVSEVSEASPATSATSDIYTASSEFELKSLPTTVEPVQGTMLSISSGETLVAAEHSALTSVPSPEQASSSIHEVQVGDTLWSIARDYGISPEALAEANGIFDPERVFVGRSLTIPAQTSDEPLQPAPTSHIDLAAAQSVVLQVPARPTSVSGGSVGLQQSLEPTLSAEPAVSPEGNVDLYVANLLEDVSDAQNASALSESSELGESAPVELASESTTFDYVDDELEASLPINPQFSSPTSQGPNDSDNPIGDNLLAAAPLGSEVYAPINENPAGRVVSPGMPILPDSSEYLPETPSHFSGYVWPAHGVLTSGYGWRWGRMHRGIDIAGPVGTPIYAAAPGVVVRSEWNSGGYGNLVDIRHPDGSMTRYAHNDRNLVESGQQVRQGQQIAEMGNTGFSTGPHLHFEIHLPNEGAVNPISYLPGQ